VKKEIQTFVRLIKQKEFFLLACLFLLFIPSENFYERLRLKLKEPLVKDIEVNLPAITDYPFNITGQKAPLITAKSALVIDIPSKVVLFNKNAKLRLPPASLTKIMTAIIVLENYQLDDVLVVPDIDNLLGQKMGLEMGEKLTVESLLYGLLVHSASDAAVTLSTADPQGAEHFISLMNQKAVKLNLLDTHFTNVIGIDDKNHYSTVRDLAFLTAYALKNPVFRKIVATPKITVTDVEQKHWYQLENTNELLGKVLGLEGVKTGWTQEAGECLVAAVKREGREIMTVLLGSRDRFGETTRLIDWVFKNHQWQKINPSIDCLWLAHRR